MTVIVYIYIHNPFITFLGGIGTIAYLFPLALFYLRDKEVRELLRKSRDIIACSICVIVFCGVKLGLGSDFVYFRQALYHFATTDMLAIPIVVLMYRWSLKLDHVLVFNGFLAALITFLCLISPPVNQIIKSVLIETVDLWKIGQEGMRGFGLSNEFLYGYGLSLGIIVSYAIYYNYFKKWWFVFYIMLCSLAILVNSRTGMVIIILSIILYLIFLPKLIIRYVVIGILSVFVAISLFPLFVKDDSVIEFAADFFLVFQRLFIEGDSDRGAIYDLSKMIVFPSTSIEWLLGTGTDLFGSDSEQSDIGFVNHLYYGGVIYLGLLLLLIYRLTNRIHNRYWLIMCWGIYIISDFKGNMFSGCGNMRLFYLIIMYEYWSHYKKNSQIYAISKQ